GLLAFAGVEANGKILGYHGGAVVHLVDAFTGKEVVRLSGHQSRINKIIFSPDGKTLASASDDATCLIWDMTAFKVPRNLGAALNRQQEKELSEKELEAAWQDLNRNAEKAYIAVWKLVATPRQATTLLQARVRPASLSVDLQQLQRWIVDLDDSRFPVRQKAR